MQENKTQSKNEVWRVVDILTWSKNFLKNKGVESSQIEAEMLLMKVLNFSRLDIYMHHERPLSIQERNEFKYLLLQRTSGIPIQYILGKTEFMSLNFFVSSDVLIPRQDTEVIIENLIEKYKTKDNIKALDLCTGSGCIAISLAHYLPNISMTAIDISEAALKIAKKNCSHNNLSNRINFLQLDILKENISDGSYNLIVSNPPYISKEKYINLNPLVRDHEPEIALYPGEDEYIFYRHLSKIAIEKLVPEGLLAVEIGGDYQVENITKIFTSAGLTNIEIIKDYNNICRGIIAKKN